jgi:hypothetical protein
MCIQNDGTSLKKSSYPVSPLAQGKSSQFNEIRRWLSGPPISCNDCAKTLSRCLGKFSYLHKPRQKKPLVAPKIPLVR